MTVLDAIVDMLSTATFYDNFDLCHKTVSSQQGAATRPLNRSSLDALNERK